MMTATAALLLMECVLLGAGGLVLTYRLVARWRSNRAERELRRVEMLAHELFESAGVQWPAPAIYRERNRAAVRAVLLTQARELTGEDLLVITHALEMLGIANAEMTALSSRRWWRRLEAAINLGAISSPHAVIALTEVLADKNEDVRMAATRALGEIGDPLGLECVWAMAVGAFGISRLRTTEVLYNAFANNPSQVLYRWERARTLNERMLLAELSGLLGIADAVSHVLALVPEPPAQEVAARALGRLNDPMTTDALLTLLASPAAAVRIEAARALGLLADPMVIEALIPLLTDEDIEVRQSASGALRSLGYFDEAVPDIAPDAADGFAEPPAAQAWPLPWSA